MLTCDVCHRTQRECFDDRIKQCVVLQPREIDCTTDMCGQCFEKVSSALAEFLRDKFDLSIPQ